MEAIMIRTTTLAFMLLIMPASTALTQPKKPAIPAAIEVPKRHKFVDQFHAKGVQVYQAKKGKDGKLEWAFDGPLADLFDGEAKAGIHYYGPAWEASDGSKVVKDDSRELLAADAPNPARDVPWLLVPVKADEPENANPGRFSRVVYVQRVATSGGRAPKELPKRVGSKIAVPYTATYYFWAASDAKD
jgi:hypothetical protein